MKNDQMDTGRFKSAKNGGYLSQILKITQGGCKSLPPNRP
jgi:hypothetical protein